MLFLRGGSRLDRSQHTTTEHRVGVAPTVIDEPTSVCSVMPHAVIRMPAGAVGAGTGAGVGRGGHLNEQQNRGIRIGCCRVCTCVNLHFLLSKNGILKCFELILGWFCQTMLIQFGLDTAKEIGEAFLGFLTCCSAFLITTSTLLLCYTISARTFHLVRQSIFEVVYNGLACAMYLSAASYLGFAVNVFLYPKFLIFKNTGGIHSAYPAMTAVYYMGGIVGLVYGVDAFVAFRHLKGYS